MPSLKLCWVALELGGGLEDARSDFLLTSDFGVGQMSDLAWPNDGECDYKNVSIS